MERKEMVSENSKDSRTYNIIINNFVWGDPPVVTVQKKVTNTFCKNYFDRKKR